eukprot:COSAG05_NODE_9747_length_604_cov_0.708911_1_plen_20_part_10
MSPHNLLGPGTPTVELSVAF